MKTKNLVCSLSFREEDGAINEFYKRNIKVNAHWIRQVKDLMTVEIASILNDFDVGGITVQNSTEEATEQ